MVALGAETTGFAAGEREVAESAPSSSRLSELVEQHYAFVWRLLRRLGFSESDSDDAAQQVFMTASRRIADIRFGSERAFLFSTAVRVASRARRSTQRRREVFDAGLEDELDPAPTGDELLERSRARAELDAILQEMELDLRVVLVLYELEELTSPEIAELIGVPLGTVASRLRRARQDFEARIARLEASRRTGGTR